MRDCVWCQVQQRTKGVAGHGGGRREVFKFKHNNASQGGPQWPRFENLPVSRERKREMCAEEEEEVERYLMVTPTSIKVFFSGMVYPGSNFCKITFI